MPFVFPATTRVANFFLNLLCSRVSLNEEIVLNSYSVFFICAASLSLALRQDGEEDDDDDDGNDGGSDVDGEGGSAHCMEDAPDTVEMNSDHGNADSESIP